jgi:hypothetical protein
MKKLMNIIVLSCKKATLLIEKNHIEPLSLINRVQLMMHLKMCDKCSKYQKQSVLIENVLTGRKQNFSNPANFKLSDLSKTRIQKAIEENLKNN